MTVSMQTNCFERIRQTSSRARGHGQHFDSQRHPFVSLPPFDLTVPTNTADRLGKLCQINSQVPAPIKKSSDLPNPWKPLVIIVPLRLGLNEVNAEYIDQLKVRTLD